MKNRKLFMLVAFAASILLPANAQYINSAISASNLDSAYLFSYATTKNRSHNGLHFAWSADKQMWYEIGPEYPFVNCDYGNWGEQKRMFNPSILQTNDGVWEAVWEVVKDKNIVAYTTSLDLIHWKPQNYYNKSIDDYFVNSKEKIYLPSAGEVVGEIHKVEWNLIKGLIDECFRAQRQSILDAERAVDDNTRFNFVDNLHTTITVESADGKQISDKLIGIFFEDINYAADGGLYAELIQNRDFEYNMCDLRNSDLTWTSTKSWSTRNAELTIDSLNPIHENNIHYAVLKTSARGALVNEGWDGIAVKKDKRYDFSMFARVVNGKGGKTKIRLVSANGELVGEAVVSVSSSSWKKLSAHIKATIDCDVARLEVEPQYEGTYNFDMVSLFPQETFKMRQNGLRADLAQVIADLKPKFIRFPGGCVAHGDGLGNLYRWKNTIGALEERVPNWNIWKYHQTVGLGYYEYFQFCEDIGAEPLPVIAAGVPCQNSSVGGYGQQGGVPIENMQEYIQDILDLIEWANGDSKTSSWAKKRADAGHRAPFNLKYIAIGNEDLISDVFKERFKMIYDAVREKYPEIVIIGTVGPNSEGCDYEEGWRFARELNIPIVDEHYYRSPGWFINHQDYYDRYRRGETKVYLGEYAAHIPGRINCLETALAEALYLCNIERNADIVAMTSYAPLLSKSNHTQWNPNMIYFDNTHINLSTGYQVQKMFANNSGVQYIPNRVVTPMTTAPVRQRIASSVVKQADGNYVVKIVNMLPIENEITIEMPIDFEKAIASSLYGDLNDTQLTPQDIKPIVENRQIKIKAPAYSFSVINLIEKEINEAKKNKK